MRVVRGGGMRVGRVPGAGLVAAACVAVLLVGGCAGGGGKGPSPSGSSSGSVSTGASQSPSSSVSGSPSPSATPSPSKSITIPPEARKHTEQGAIAFAKLYAMEVSRGQHDPKSSNVRQLQANTCSICNAIADGIQRMEGSGQRTSTVRLTISAAQIGHIVSKDEYIVLVLGTERAAELLDSSGRVLSQVGEEVSRSAVTVTWTDHGWRVNDVKVVSV